MSESSPLVPARPPLLSNRSYDLLKHVAQLYLPALGALYFTLAQIWHLPKPEEVVGSITAVDAFLGVVLGLATIAYNQSGLDTSGVLNVVDPGDKENPDKVLTLGLDVHPEDIQRMKTVTFRVNSNL